MKIAVIVTVVSDSDNLIIRNVPVSSTVVELSDGTLAIIDTGMADNPQLAEELKDLGYSPLDFSLVINTHLHPDHIGGNQLFKNARILISREEFEYETKFARVLQASHDPVATLRSLGRYVDDSTYALARDLQAIVEQYPAASLVGAAEQLEFLEDEPELPAGVSLLSVPGHSIDSRAVILRGATRQVAVAGDAMYHRDLWREVPYIGIHYDDDMFKQSIERLTRFSGIIVPGHDRPFDTMTQRYVADEFIFL
ncbi:MAG: MBL fold metallo-hydrolase [Syntrophomonadaceae bacterium]|nr:MBL fold metallo-hydrolase [Syntrophomonadaceae bacterium]